MANFKVTTDFGKTHQQMLELVGKQFNETLDIYVVSKYLSQVTSH